MHKISSVFATTAAISLFTITPAFAQVTNPPAGGPKLSVITPQEGQTIYGDRVPILFSPEGIELKDYTAYPTITPGQGHIHVWLDDAAPTKETAKMVTEDNTTYSDVPPGNHTLKAELVNNNHSSFNPPVIVTVNFKTAPVGSPAPAPSPTFDKNTAAVILVVVALVIIAAWWYTKDDEDEETSNQKPETRKTTKKKSASRSRRK